MRKERLLDKITLEELIALYDNGKGMCAREIGQLYGFCEQTVYNNLKGHVHGRGGKHAKKIPRHEFCKEEEMQVMAEQNAENACVMLERCCIKLTASVCEYEINTGDKKVLIWFEDNELEINIDKIPELIEELKGVCRCAKSFEMGNAMW